MGKKSRLLRLIKIITYFGVVSTIPLLIYSAYIYFSLPTINPKQCMTTKMFQVRLCPGSPGYVPYRLLSKELIDALILSEDGSFFSHHGFDWYEIKESFKENWRQGRIARGGSTITQQLAKNMYLSRDKTISRKIQEYFISSQIESKMSKSQILERYFNIVEFGPKIFGIQRAAAHYFKKTPAQLSLLESVFLVSLLPNPKGYSRGFSDRKLTSSNIFRMKIILRRFFRSQKMNQALYNHYVNLTENMDWPFGNAFDQVPSVFQELKKEIGDFENTNGQISSDSETEVPLDEEASPESPEDNIPLEYEEPLTPKDETESVPESESESESEESPTDQYI